MSGEIFDLERLRRNFDRARDPVPGSADDRLGGVSAPRDPFVAAREALDVVRRQIPAELAGHERTVAPFVDRIARLLASLERAALPDGHPELGAEPCEDANELRAALDQELADLEDLCSALLGLG